MDVVSPIAQVVGAIALLAPSPAPGPWTATLDHLDLVRSAAFARRDPSMLEGVYVAGTGLAEEDAAVMADWRRRGLALGPVRVRVLRASEVSRTDRRVVLDVVDRLEPVGARDGDGRWHRLPRDGATDRRVVLRLTDGGWRVESSVRVAG
ncbi:hypothetical protein [Solicola sp. PLA-1-18]|uniref:hypothetical protein n=1 Tax=Solicola sp. PLA-1-18 TaxID=3380532 RepID=UPI003B7769BC